MNEAQTTADRFDFERLRQDLRETGRNLWLAGLGALGTMAELDAESRTLFDRLVERGRPVEERQKRAFDEMSDRASSRLREAGRSMRDQVRDDLQKALKRAGVPTAEDFERLSARLEALSHTIDELSEARQN